MPLSSQPGGYAIFARYAMRRDTPPSLPVYGFRQEFHFATLFLRASALPPPLIAGHYAARAHDIIT
jgi:hypothetical protein